jgi:hypothetical protein
MSELYWLGILGNLHELGIAVAILSGFLCLCFFFFVIMDKEDGKETLPLTKKWFNYSITAFVFGIFLCFFIPSQKNLLIIYGVGGTIDYLKENKDANKIPDKCIKALDKYLDDALKEDKE